MNTGAFGENFPYSNFHDLNMDWIIKIAKDFLDQYTHIQETLDNGLEALDEKATNLEALLQAWYDTHSTDIANQLADALQDLNQTLQTNEALFLEYSTTKAREAIESIPSDYTTLYNEVQSIGESSKDNAMMQFCPQEDYNWSTGIWEVVNNELSINDSQTAYRAIHIKNVPKGYYFLNHYSAGQTYIKNLKTGVFTSLYAMGYTTSNVNLILHIDTLSDFYITINTTHVSIKDSVLSNIWCRKNVLNPYDWQTGYWNNITDIVSDSNYKCTKVENLPAGIYEFNYYAKWQTYIKNRTDNTAIALASLGYDSNQKITIEIPYNFDLYLTQKSDLPYEINTVFEHEVVQSDKFEYGEFKEEENVFHVGITRKIQLLSAGIELARKFPKSKLYVDAGNYNMYSELGGDTYFDNYVADNNVPKDWYEPNWGIFLSNEIHIICEEGTKIYFLYQGSNTDVHTRFSLFNGGRLGFTLENADIVTSNIRYSIHDDMGEFVLPYKTSYKHCKVSHDSSETTWGAHQAIGGGFGRHGVVLFDSCEIVSTFWESLSYHNAAGISNAELTSGVYSKLIMRDCYLSGAIVTNAYGRSQDMTEVFISGCNVGTNLPDPQITGNYGVMNIVSTRWNNYVREP